jgi:uncharacterized repeat protein (TIGR03803 family)
MFEREVVLDERAGQQSHLSSARHGGFRKTLGVLAAGAVFMAGAFGLPAAHAAELALNYQVLYTFTGGNDGGWPAGNLIADKQGNLYGMTSVGGPNGAGTVFKLAPDGTESVIYHFNGADGNLPMAGLLADAAGNFYGVTEIGGKYGAGNVFRVTPDGVYTSLYDFGASNVDGFNPVCQLVWGPHGELVGTTVNGGTGHLGTVFSVTLDGKATILHNFTGMDGEYPPAGVVMDAAGSLYGVTHNTSPGSSGTVYKIDANGVFSVLYTFDNASGFFTHAALTLDANQNLYGTTQAGGATGYGNVFKLTPDGTFTALYSFTGGADGSSPSAQLFLDRKGNLIGTTLAGGNGDNGTIFSVAPDGTLTTLHSFNGTKGSHSQGGLVRDPAAGVLWLYGTTYAGGSSGNGVVYRVRR